MSAESSKEVCQDCAPTSGTAAEQTTAVGSTSAPAEPASTPAAEPKPEEQAPFTPPSLESLKPSITIEFCDRCRWSVFSTPYDFCPSRPLSEIKLTHRAPRATWIQTELFLTFPTPLLKSITLQPLTSPETGGRFRVWIYLDDRVEMVWDRKVSW